MVIGTFIIWLVAAVLLFVAGAVPTHPWFGRLLAWGLTLFVIGWMIELGYVTPHRFTFN